MSWIKLDDQWMDHPKMIRAGRDARDLWLAGMTYCAKHLTDGFIPDEALPMLAILAGIDVANAKQNASKLLEVCLWDASTGGYQIHDYLDYNPTKEQALATKEARKEAGRRGGQAKASKTPSKTLAKSKQKSAPSPSPSYIEPSNEGALERTVAELKKPDVKNEPAIVAKLFTERFGDTFQPNYARLARMAGEVSGKYITLANLIWDCGKPDGDPHDYLQAVVNKSDLKLKARKNGKRPERVDPEIAFREKLAAGEIK